MGNNKGKSVKVIVLLQQKDLQAMESLKEKFGLGSDSAAVRFALRVAARLGYNVLTQTLGGEENVEED